MALLHVAGPRALHHQGGLGRRRGRGRGAQRNDGAAAAAPVRRRPAIRAKDAAKKKALDRAITDDLVQDPGLRPEDALIVLSPNGREERCFGHGLATDVTDAPA